MDEISTGAAVLWWIGVAALFLVVIPLVLFLVHRVLSDLREIKDYAGDVREHAAGISKNLAPVTVLLETRDLTKDVCAGLGRYVAAVGQLLQRTGASR